MEAGLAQEYVAAARFDYIKLRWRYAGLDFTEEVRATVLEAYVKLQAAVPHQALKDPKFTVIPASPNKPDGLYLVELYGFAAECVRTLPAGWLANVTYAHVKAYAHGMRYAQVRELQQRYLFNQGRRAATLINGGNAGRSKKGVGMPALRIGSRKSDWHGIVYARKGFAPGFEGRFRDEGVHQRTLAALDFWNQGEEEDAGAWGVFLRSLARETAQCFQVDAMQRGVDLGEFVPAFGGYSRQDFDQMPLDVGEEEMVDPPTFDGSDYREPAPMSDAEFEAYQNMPESEE